MDWFGLGKDGNVVCAFECFNAHSWSNDFFGLFVLKPDVAGSNDALLSFGTTCLKIHLNFIGNQLGLPLRLD